MQAQIKSSVVQGKLSSSHTIVGVDIGGTKTAVSVLERNEPVREVERFTTRGSSETLARIIALIKGIDIQPPFSIGISCGTLGANRGLITKAPNLPGWDDVPIVDLLSSEFGAEAFLLNDAKACALAEWIFGAGQGCQHMAFLTAGTGMGAGLILNGELYLGTGNAGEVGHIRLAESGPWGHGKLGSFEGFCSGGGIGRLADLRIRDIVRQGGKMPLRAETAELTAKDVIAAARKGNNFAINILGESGTYLGQALSILVDVLGLERIVLGSIYLRAQDWLEPAMRKALHAEALPDSLRVCEILPAALGEGIGNYGAIAVAQYGLRGQIAT